MRITPEVNNIDSKRMRVDTMTQKGEVNFSEECKSSLYLYDKVGTKRDNKHAKHEA